MNKIVLITGYILFLTWNKSEAQNIIPNGSFEDLSEFRCDDSPIEGFRLVNSWAAWLFSTPHLYTDGCPYDRSIWHWWDPADQVAHGFNCVGLGGTLLINGTKGSVSMGAILDQPIQIGKEYYLQFQVRNNGMYHREPDSLRVCDTDPPRGVQITFGGEDLLDPLMNDQTQPDLFYTSSGLQQQERTSWEQFVDCFRLDEQHTHIAFAKTIGPVQMSEPCEVRPLSGVLDYYVYNYDFDDLILYPVPLSIDSIFISCTPQEYNINLIQIANIPPRVDVEFLWDDGFIGGDRVIGEVGTYEIEAKLECTSFPIFLTLVEEDCQPQFFAPNAFSPNGDGVNDEFRPFIKSEFEVQNYSLAVFDRWGNQVFTSTAIENAWNGQSKGQSLPMGVYVWVIQYDVITDQDVVTEKEMGNVLIVK